MDPRNLQVLPLHKNPQYLRACCDLINDEWPRSETARMMSLQASRDELPTSLILVDKKTMLGHCKLTPIPSMPESCFVETVVISKSMRGQKLGSYLMHYVEDYCKNVLKSKMIHLSTKGQENFYAKLGYKVCAPVSIYGVRVPSSFKASINSPKTETPVPLVTAGPVPPPPPMPKTEVFNSNHATKSSKTYMFKLL